MTCRRGISGDSVGGGGGAGDGGGPSRRAWLLQRQRPEGGIPSRSATPEAATGGGASRRAQLLHRQRPEGAVPPGSIDIANVID
jgi:hypothetical protein